ncbi:hypothetical protein [Chamaesiphon sp. VAR_48_metabat_403]|uniref:hypothetical protein n=1 Tax=Chamaesiphon sp. VAR_48_metabat_403 TaxID=2964700 RepID=UPI00286DA7BC|nr:hypothetical protein [Chamaesiphon sp. VAR_48_metabat_403]
MTQNITGNILYPQVWESSRILIRVISSIPPVWRKAGYLKIEALIDGEYFVDEYRPIEFGNNLVKILLPAYRLSFEPVNRLISIYPNTSISIYQLSINEVRSLQMSGSYIAANPAIGSDSETIKVASVTSIELLPANPNRSPEGLIVNNANRDMWVRFGSAAAVAASPCVEILRNGGNYDIPGGYTGVINGIWESGATGSCVVHEFSYI